MQTFTSNNLLLHLFNELPSDIALEIEQGLHSDSHLRNEFSSYQETITDIENFNMTPNPKLIENILSKFHHEKDAYTV